MYSIGKCYEDFRCVKCYNKFPKGSWYGRITSYKKPLECMVCVHKYMESGGWKKRGEPIDSLFKENFNNNREMRKWLILRQL